MAALPTGSAAEIAAFEMVILRLEAVAAAFEAKYGITPDPTTLPEAVEARVQAASKRTGCGGGVVSFGETHTAHSTSATGLSAAAEERDPSLVDFDKISNGAIGEYFRLSAKLGVPLSHQAELVRASFVAQRRLMKIVPQTREPGPKILNQLLEATNETLTEVQAMTDAHYGSDFDIHLGAVAEGMKALAWVTVGMMWNDTNKPPHYIKGKIASMQREYLEGVFECHADKPDHIAWAKAWAQTLDELLAYVTKWHTDKVGWGKKARSMTFWSNAISQTAPGEGTADAYEYSTKLGMPVSRD